MRGRVACRRFRPCPEFFANGQGSVFWGAKRKRQFLSISLHAVQLIEASAELFRRGGQKHQQVRSPTLVATWCSDAQPESPSSFATGLEAWHLRYAESAMAQAAPCEERACHVLNARNFRPRKLGRLCEMCCIQDIF